MHLTIILIIYRVLSSR